MSYRLIKVEKTKNIPSLPYGAYYYKTKNGKRIYKNRYTNEFYIVYANSLGEYVVEYYVGDCQC